MYTKKFDQKERKTLWMEKKIKAKARETETRNMKKKHVS
jgi:hypothetical protein